jgi:hypothetical protein
MKYLRLLIAAILSIIGILIFRWLLALREILDTIARIIRRWILRRRLEPKRASRGSDAPCEPINQPAFSRPDPLIYSQYDLMARGFAVTWDNPDIELRLNGAPVSSASIQPDTEYEIVARVWNGSTTAVAVGLPVVFSYLSFGIGVQSHPIGATSIPQLGVKGGPDQPAFASMRWRTPAASGHYCLQVLLAPADDSNYANNLGQENLVVRQAASPATFEFKLGNAAWQERAFRFETDTYTLPERPPCSSDRRGNVSVVANRSDAVNRGAVPAEHSRDRYPVPEGWAVSIEPDRPILHPEEEVNVRVMLEPPAGFRGRQPFNVNAFDEHGFVGGVTLLVEVP